MKAVSGETFSVKTPVDAANGKVEKKYCTALAKKIKVKNKVGEQ